jgi:hypothetical protein
LKPARMVSQAFRLPRVSLCSSFWAKAQIAIAAAEHTYSRVCRAVCRTVYRIVCRIVCGKISQ